MIHRWIGVAGIVCIAILLPLASFVLCSVLQIEGTLGSSSRSSSW